MKNKKTLMLAQLGILTAVIFLFDITKIGYIPITPPTVSIMMIPVAIGAMTCGKTGGTIMGLVFGISSMIQCFTGNALGALILSVNPLYTVVLNVGVRVLVGFLTGLIFEVLNKRDKTKIWSYGVTACAASVLNSVIYVPVLVVLFGGSVEFQRMFTGENAEKTALGAFFAIVLGILLVSMIIEAVACTVIGGAVAKVVNNYVNKK